MKKALLITLIIICFVVQSGCVGVQGGTEQFQSQQTVGQELIDLKRAKDSGAITQEEYEKLKMNIMKRYD